MNCARIVLEPIMNETQYSWSSSHLRLSFRHFQMTLLILTGLMAILFLCEAFRFLPVVGDNIYPEAAGVLSARQWAEGSRLYQDYRQFPYQVTAFPPLWYAALALAAKVLRMSDLDSLMLFGRVLTMASLFGVVGLGYRWNRRLGHSVWLALLTATFYLSFPILLPWAVSARPDFLALFFTVLALYWATLHDTVFAVCIAGTASALALLTLQSTVAAPVAIVLWLLESKRWKHAALFCAVCAGIVGTTLLCVQWSSNGLLFLNLSGAKFGHFALTYVRDVLGRLLNTPGHGFAVALFALGAFGLLEALKREDRRFRLLSIYLLMSVGLALLGSAAEGAGVNRYLEPAFAMAVLVPTGMARLQDAWKNESPFSSFAMVMMLFLLLPSLDVQRWNAMHNRPENVKSMLALVQSYQVFTDIPYLASRASTPQLVDLASLVNAERTNGRFAWSSAKLVNDLREREYEVVILSEPVDSAYIAGELYPRYPHLDPAIRTAIQQNYQLCSQRGSSYIYGRLARDRNERGSGCLQPETTLGQTVTRLGRP